MNPKCKTQINAARVAAGGRPLTDAQAAKFDTMIGSAMRQLAREDANWKSYTRDQRYMMGAEEASRELAAAAQRKIHLAQLQAIKSAEVEARMQKQRDLMGWNREQAWANEIQQADNDSNALRGEYSAMMMDAITAATSTEGASLARAVGMKVLGLDNPQMTLDIARELHAHGKAGTGNDLAVLAAQAFERTNEALRLRRNAAGGDTGRLEYGYMPNAWESELVVSAGYDKFAADILPELDRSYYVREDGSPMSDSEVLGLLRAAGETIGTDGANHMGPRPMGKGALANRGNEHRQIHWKSGDAYIRAMQKYGSGSMYDALLGHVHTMTRDIAMLERFGPNPNAQHTQQKQLSAQEGGGSESLVTWSSLDQHWAQVAGVQVSQWRYTPPLIGKGLEAVTMGRASGEFTGAGSARFWQHARNAEVFSKLQGILLSSFTDLPTYFATTGFNKQSYFDSITNLPRAMTPVARRELVDFMNQQGLMADTLIDNLNRFTGDHVGASWSGHIASATMKLSLANWWQDGIRRAFTLTMQQGMARWAKAGWASLDEWTQKVLLESRGIGPDEFAVLQKATPVKTKWGDIITPEAIYATGDPLAPEVVKRYLGLLQYERTMAAVGADVSVRAFIKRGTEPGTMVGEGARIFGQFKTFPVAMITRHWRRMLKTPRGLEGAPLGYRQDSTVNKAALLGAFIVSMTALGAISFQAKQIAAGKDPVDMTTAKFWVRAMAQGGGAGFLGDVLLRNTADDQTPQQGLFELLGPIPGSFAQGYELTKGNYDEWASGKDTHAGAEGLRFARSHLPLVNLWYAKAALDHAGLYALQENLSPGYLSRIQSKAHKDWGQDFWLDPDSGDIRAPDFSAIAGD